MKPISVKLPFVYQDLVEAQKLVWDFYNRNFISLQIKFLLAGIICLTAGILSQDWISLGLGGGFISYIIFGCIGFYERKKRFLKKIKRYIDFEGRYYWVNFEENVFEYEDQEKKLILQWSMFESFLEYKNYILISLKNDDLISFTFSRNELGEANYQQVLLFLNKKINDQPVLLQTGY